LTPAQRVQVENLPEPDLFQLDMAALLRLYDRNWSELAFKQNYPRNGRNLIKELMSVRNRWAHEPAGGQAYEDLFRDLDTVRRFLQILGTEEELLDRVEGHRLSVLEVMAAAVRSEKKPAGPEARAEGDLNAPETVDIGARLALIGAGQLSSSDATSFAKHVSRKTFIGIDFGTSTTVASYIRVSSDGSGAFAEPIVIAQSLPDGRRSSSHLVPSCIAVNPDDSEVLFGMGAKELQYSLREGIDVWSSFKMELGTDLGPRYRNTKLRTGAGPIVIEKPQDAAREFFKFLRVSIDDFLSESNLPKEIALAVSVPASFEANQRRDLLLALEEAGFDLDASCLVDEPNAAFLSVLHESWREEGRLIFDLARASKNLLVFDFGAGTCDISILRISVSDDVVHSRNLAISRFIALGGDNIDRAIARDILLPQMLEQSPPDHPLPSEQTEQIVVPRLMPVAERLKIQCSRALGQRGLHSVDECEALSDHVTEHSIPDFKIGGQTLSLRDPRLSYRQFAGIMRKFLAQPGEESDDGFEQIEEDSISIFTPIESALEKANLDRDRLDAVIFIGGSSESPLVQNAIRDHFGRFVESFIPRDLRTHVSQGAALHSFARHAYNANVIQPITSEPIMLVTVNGGLEPILAAGSEVPTKAPSTSRFRVVHKQQAVIELPICVTSEDKILAVLKITPECGDTFREGDEVMVRCSMTADKLLKVEAAVGDRPAIVQFVNPLANTSLTDDETRFLIAQQRFNRAVLAGRGRPAVSEVIAYARAASDASRFLHAAELYEQVERLDPERDFAVNVCYNYDRASKSGLAEIWAEKAYQRGRSALTAYNVAIFKYRNGNLTDAKRMLQEALAIEPKYAAAHALLGEISDRLGEGGEVHHEAALDILCEALKREKITEDDCYRLAKAAKRMGRTRVAKQAELTASKLRRDQDLYKEQHLVGRIDRHTELAKR
jgi:molecular chaperone DnaK (HSP70)